MDNVANDVFEQLSNPATERPFFSRSVAAGRRSGKVYATRYRSTCSTPADRDIPMTSEDPVREDPARDNAAADRPAPLPVTPKAVSSQKKILVVDDDFEIIESVRYALEGAGYSVVIARDGNQGLALAERENPDLMILDMMMPKRSGFLVLEKLRRLRDVPLPVIMITGNEGSRHKAYAELLGVSDYIRKPFAMDRLIDAVEKLLPS